MRFFAVLFAMVLAVPAFTQSDSVAILNNKLDQMQYQFYILQSKINSIDNDLSSFKNLSSDSIKVLMQKNEALGMRVEESEAQLNKQSMSIDMLDKAQHTQGNILISFLWVVAIALLILTGFLIFSFINTRKRLFSQRTLLEKLFTDNLKILETELKEIMAANREKSIALEAQLSRFSDDNTTMKIQIDKNRAKSKKEHQELEKAIIASEKELNKNLSSIKQKITKTEKKFSAADKTLASAIKENEKLLREKVDKLKVASQKEHKALMKKLNSGLKKSDEKMKSLQKDFKSTQKRKTVTFRVKKSS